MRRAANVDRSHPEIVNAFEGLGCSVLSLAALGRGVPDLVVGIPGSPAINLLVEVKSFPAHTEKGVLTQEQKDWHSSWRGQVAIVRSLEDVGRLVKAARMQREVVV